MVALPSGAGGRLLAGKGWGHNLPVGWLVAGGGWGGHTQRCLGAHPALLGGGTAGSRCWRLALAAPARQLSACPPPPRACPPRAAAAADAYDLRSETSGTSMGGMSVGGMVSGGGAGGTPRSPSKALSRQSSKSNLPKVNKVCAGSYAAAGDGVRRDGEPARPGAPPALAVCQGRGSGQPCRGLATALNAGAAGAVCRRWCTCGRRRGRSRRPRSVS